MWCFIEEPAEVFPWIMGGLIAIALTLTYAELGGMPPVAGALAIPHFSHGSINSFPAGWLCRIAYVATAPIEVTAVLQYSSNYLPWLTVTEQGEQVLSHHGVIVAAALMLLFTIVNLMGVRWLTRNNTVNTYWKSAVPFVVAVVLIAEGFRVENFFDAEGFAPHLRQFKSCAEPRYNCYSRCTLIYKTSIMYIRSHLFSMISCTDTRCLAKCRV